MMERPRDLEPRKLAKISQGVGLKKTKTFEIPPLECKSSECLERLQSFKEELTKHMQSIEENLSVGFVGIGYKYLILDEQGEKVDGVSLSSMAALSLDRKSFCSLLTESLIDFVDEVKSKAKTAQGRLAVQVTFTMSSDSIAK